jgi:hypothetical protein
LKADNHDIAEPALRIEALVRINHELAEEVDRLNRVIQVLTGPEVQRRSRVLVWRQGRTRSLEKILSAVAEMER